MKIIIGADHHGLKLKADLISSLSDEYSFEDVGAYDYVPDDDYPMFAIKVGELVVSNSDHRGIVICRSGIGVSIAANKVVGVRAALVSSESEAKMARLDNDANVIALAAGQDRVDFTPVVRVFLNTNFSHIARHQRRIQIISDYERSNV